MSYTVERCKLSAFFAAGFDGSVVGVKIMHPEKVVFSEEVVPPYGKPV